MKYSPFVVLLIFFTISPVFSRDNTIPSTNLISVGYGIHTNYCGEDIDIGSVSLNFVGLKGQKGFYSNISPYFGINGTADNQTVSLIKNKSYFVGSDLLLGFGGDINLGNSGFIIGVGPHFDLNALIPQDGYWMDLSAGIGSGVNFYYHPNDKSFVLNAGLKIAWDVYHFSFLPYSDSLYSGFRSDSFNINFNIGIGWRTAHQSKSSDTK